MLKVENLSVSLPSEEGYLTVLHDLSYELKDGEILAVVGESGCGKTISALALNRVLPAGAKVTGKVLLDGVDLLKLSEEQMRKVRGAKIAMIFQDPMTSLNPAFTVANLMKETLKAHEKITSEEALKKAEGILSDVEIDKKFLFSYPHQLSGGMRQRVMIALALCCNPAVLIADEPTTSLDLTTQKQILDLLKKLQRQKNLSILFITHNLAIVNDIAHKVLVLYGGRKVETAQKETLFNNPAHPYTKGLLSSLVTLQSRGDRLPAIEGAPPPAGRIFEGCSFAERCKFATEKCFRTQPPLIEVDKDHFSLCFFSSRADGAPCAE